MFSDSHFHFMMTAQDSVERGAEILSAMTNVMFALDIGTKSFDLSVRQTFANNVFDKIASTQKDNALTQQAKNLLHFSAGIWPDQTAIKNREAELQTLVSEIENAQAKIVAIGECGLDHHWNVDGAENDFDFAGEAEMFEAQIMLAKKLSLPVIVHSRDAFDQTFSVIKNCSYDNGVIHCFSYGKKEAQMFLERGWYVSLSGAVTYTKKSQIEKMRETICSIPDELLLIETDSPYLSPVPLRGTSNTPLNIKHTYDYVASMRGVSAEQLSDTVENNCKKLFGV